MDDKRQDSPDWPDAAKRRWMSALVRYAGGAEPLERQPPTATRLGRDGPVKECKGERSADTS